jgi:UDP-N-acetylmuramate dehydrogenase
LSANLFRTDISLQPYNTFGVEARAAFFLEVADEETLHEALSTGLLRHRPLLILGSGSNILFTRDYPGTVLHNRLQGIRVLREDAEEVTVRAASGEVWDDLVRFAVLQRWYGAENLSLIPGTVGAAAVQNIGAYGAEVQDLIVAVEGVDMQSGEKKVFPAGACRFGYRDSIFKHLPPGTFFITQVTFRFSKKHRLNLSYPALREALQGMKEPDLPAVREAVIRIRRSKLPDPAETGNAGSFFKNPVTGKAQLEKLRREYPAIPFHPVKAGRYKIPAAWLIEQSGMKGIQEGHCGTWPRQPLVIVSDGKAAGTEIDRFAEKIAATVKEKFNILLDREVITL